jgi:hypothetical protein
MSRGSSIPYRESQFPQRVIVYWYVKQHGRRGIFNIPVGIACGIAAAIACKYAQLPQIVSTLLTVEVWCIMSLRRSVSPPTGAPVIWRQEVSK